MMLMSLRGLQMAFHPADGGLGMFFNHRQLRRLNHIPGSKGTEISGDLVRCGVQCREHRHDHQKLQLNPKFEPLK